VLKFLAIFPSPLQPAMANPRTMKDNTLSFEFMSIGAKIVFKELVAILLIFQEPFSPESGNF
jgi:hypothetical protein